MCGHLSHMHLHLYVYDVLRSIGRISRQFGHFTRFKYLRLFPDNDPNSIESRHSLRTSAPLIHLNLSIVFISN